MPKFDQNQGSQPKTGNSPRDWFARKLGIHPVRKAEIYRDLIQAVTLQDISYWLQILFSAGIATLGLVLNSPAVIIGAMLISPLMGVILATGLAFAAGDLILAIRAIVNLVLSCLAAIGFAFVLVSVLPFKELTAEIASRTQPTTLDLVIALFSGALGAVAISKDPKGVATSIPGVAIAVALMPPLCVLGYGIGVATSLNWANGIQIASGGGLLFLTNLTAIMFMAMVVFWVLHISLQSMQDQVLEWHQQDPESFCVERLLDQFPVSSNFKNIGSLPNRFILVLILVFVLLFPLSQSLAQLQQEIAQKQLDNRISQVGTSLWQENFATFPDGKIRSDISKFSAEERNGKLVLWLSVFTSKFYSADEKVQYTEMVASRLGRVPDSVTLQLTEIPTASSDIISKLLAPPPSLEPTPTSTPPPTIAETQTTFLQQTESALHDLNLPPPAQLLRYEISTSPVEPLILNLTYLSEREIAADAKTLLRENIRRRLQFSTAEVTFERIAAVPGVLTFDWDQFDLNSTRTQLLDRIGQTLQQQPNVQLQMTINVEAMEPEGIGNQRAQAVRQYLTNRWKIKGDRLVSIPGKMLNRGERPTIAFRLKLPDNNIAAAVQTTNYRTLKTARKITKIPSAT